MAREAGCKDTARSVAIERDRAGRVDRRAGLKLQGATEAVERALAAKRERNGRLAGQMTDLGHKAVGGLIKRDVEGQCVSLRHKGSERGLEAAREIGADRVEIENEALRGRAQFGIAGRLDAQGLAENGLTQHQCTQVEGLHLYFHGKLRQDRLVGRRGRLLGRQRLSLDIERADLKPIDLQPPHQQGSAPPDETGLVEGQPNSVFVGDADVAHRRVRRQDAIDGADVDLGRGRRERSRDEAGEHVLLVCTGSARHSVENNAKHRDANKPKRRYGETDDKGPSHAHQKACPMLT
ncbi:hypothetical protein [Bradyrhizobium sp. JR3.5]